MRVVANRCLAVFGVLALVGMARPADGPAIDPVWLAKARTELRAVLEKYDKVSRRLEETSEIRSEKAPGSASKMPFRPQTRRERVVRLGDDVLLERVRILDDQPKSPQIKLECENGDYHFELSKKREDGAYALSGAGLGKSKNRLVDQVVGVHAEAFSHLRDASGAVENDGKSTLRALRFDPAKGLLRIDYKYAAGETPAENGLFIDPSRGWAVVERRVETPYLVAAERWTYGTTIDGVEFPSGFTNLTTYKMANAPPNMEITGKVTSIKLTDKAPADFRLSAFGMPEPMGAPPPPKPTRWYLWILVAAGVCAALAFALAHLRRRYAAATPRTAP